MLENSCRICLNNDAQCFDVTTELFKRFFKEIIGDKNLPDIIYLCICCTSIMKKIRRIVKTAAQSQEILSYSKDSSQIQKEIFKQVFLISHHNEHTDIPPSILPDTEIKEEIIEYINVDSNYEQLEIEHFKREDNLDVEENGADVSSISNLFELSMNVETTFELKNNSRTEENETSKVQNKKRINYDEMKFDVRYLNLEEQLADLEKKRSLEKYKRMKFKCESCAVGFLTSEIFEEHQKWHTEAAGPHVCTTCHLRFKTPDVLSHHILAHRRRFSCRLCHAVFNRWSQCVGHRFKCDVEGITMDPAVCEMCQKIFSNKHLLNIHVKGVHKTPNYACCECDKKFLSKQKLTVHTRSHTGARPFACKQCSRTFAHHSNLVSHQVTHDPSRPHYCVECDTRYKTRRGLFRHLAEATNHATTGSNKYKCTECCKQFKSEKRLLSHTMGHTTALKCQHCDKVFTSNINLCKHVKKAHSL